MARRRYISTKISIDKDINKMACEHGSFGVFTALLFSWMIPHAEDNTSLTGDPYEIKMTVVPGLEQTTEDVEKALTIMAEHGLILWDKRIPRIEFPVDVFYGIQTYIGEKNRISANTIDTFLSTAENAELRRETPKNTASPSPSPSLSPSPSPSKALHDTIDLRKDLEPSDKQALHALVDVEGLEFDLVPEIKYLRKKKREFPDKDVCVEFIKWTEYKKDNPLEEGSKHHGQIATWLKKAGKSKASGEWKQKLDKAFDMVFADYPSQETMGEARKMWYSKLPESLGSDECNRKINNCLDHKKKYLAKQKDPHYIMGIAKFIGQVDFEHAPLKGEAVK